MVGIQNRNGKDAPDLQLKNDHIPLAFHHAFLKRESWTPSSVVKRDFISYRGKVKARMISATDKPEIISERGRTLFGIRREH